MFASLFTPELWKSIETTCKIFAFVLTGLGAINGAIAFIANRNFDALTKAPRSLTSTQKQELSRPPAPSVKTPSLKEPTEPVQPTAQKAGVLLISVGGDEANSYADQIGESLKGEFRVARFQIGMMNNTQAGISFIPNGNDPQPILLRLQKAGLHATPSELPILPIPASISSQFSGFVALVIGPKPAD